MLRAAELSVALGCEVGLFVFAPSGGLHAFTSTQAPSAFLDRVKAEKLVELRTAAEVGHATCVHANMCMKRTRTCEPCTHTCSRALLMLQGFIFSLGLCIIRMRCTCFNALVNVHCIISRMHHDDIMSVCMQVWKAYESGQVIFTEEGPARKRMVRCGMVHYQLVFLSVCVLGASCTGASIDRPCACKPVVGDALPLRLAQAGMSMSCVHLMSMPSTCVALLAMQHDMGRMGGPVKQMAADAGLMPPPPLPTHMMQRAPGTMLGPGQIDVVLGTSGQAVRLEGVRPAGDAGEFCTVPGLLHLPNQHPSAAT